tara:strand:- start:1949 stop:2854 length:906 start_codon:yes stop_codon:yes gene_type:complete
MPKDKKIYRFLKQNNLTQKSEEEFNSEYNNSPEKQEQLYAFFKDNNLTQKDKDSFTQEYFGSIGQGKEAPSVDYVKEFGLPDASISEASGSSTDVTDPMVAPTDKTKKPSGDIPMGEVREVVKYPGIEIPTVKGVSDSIPELQNYEGIIKGSDTAKKFADLVKDKTYVLGAKGLGNYTTKDGKSVKTSPDEIDCSGTVCTVRNAQGMSYDLTMTNAAKFKTLAKKTNIPVNKSSDGDLILMNTKGKKIDHIGFVVVDEYGDRFIAESSSSYDGTTITPFNDRIKDLENRKPKFTYEIVSDK